MKTELEKFIHQETKSELRTHHLFLTQLFLLSKDWEKEHDGRPLTVFQCLLQYIIEINDRNDPELTEYMESLNKSIENKKR